MTPREQLLYDRLKTPIMEIAEQAVASRNCTPSAIDSAVMGNYIRHMHICPLCGAMMRVVGQTRFGSDLFKCGCKEDVAKGKD